MGNAGKALVVWMAALVLTALLEWYWIGSDVFNTHFFVVAQAPLYALVLFGAYAMFSIGYHLWTLEDCTEADKELKAQVETAKKELRSKGMQI